PLIPLTSPLIVLRSPLTSYLKALSAFLYLRKLRSSFWNTSNDGTWPLAKSMYLSEWFSTFELLTFANASKALECATGGGPASAQGGGAGDGPGRHECDRQPRRCDPPLDLLSHTLPPPDLALRASSICSETTDRGGPRQRKIR